MDGIGGYSLRHLIAISHIAEFVRLEYEVPKQMSGD